MFRKVHHRLTLLCAGITTLILLTLSFIYLYVSETGLMKNQFLAFQRDVNTVISNFEQQTVISYEWLTKIESNNSYIIYVMDNGVPFQFNERNKDETRKAVEKEALQYYHSHFNVAPLTSDYISYHTEYEFRSSDGIHYYSCFATIPRDSGSVEVLILASQELLHQQIKGQRLRFYLLDISAIILLFLFSYFFTKKLLLPIEESRKEQVQFIASASHELRTPLAVMLSCANACKKASPEEQEGFLSTIQSEGHRMSRLIDDMLFLSKADNYVFDIHKSQIEADTLLLNSYEAFEIMAKEKNITMHIKLPEQEVPTILSDSERLSQVIAILVHNAVSYTGGGGTITLTLEESDSKGNHCLSFIIADNGIGIPDEEKEHIFKRFYRSDKSRSDKNHFGLGLCIASEIIAALNGTIQVTDTPGGGSTFTVTIPRQHQAPS